MQLIHGAQLSVNAFSHMAAGLGMNRWLGHLRRDMEIVCGSASLCWLFLLLLGSFVPCIISAISLSMIEVRRAGKDIFTGFLACKQATTGSFSSIIWLCTSQRNMYDELA